MATALVDNKHNTEMLRNRYLIRMFQERLPHELFFIAIDNQGQVIISPNKKMVATYMVGELAVIVYVVATTRYKVQQSYNKQIS